MGVVIGLICLSKSIDSNLGGIGICSIFPGICIDCFSGNDNVKCNIGSKVLDVLLHFGQLIIPLRYLTF